MEIEFDDSYDYSEINRDISTEKVYLTSPQLRAILINPNIYVGKQSRGTGKSTRIQALRSMFICNSVPQAVHCFYNATYIGLQLRTLPGTIAGWNKFGWREDRDYIINKEPPAGWARPHDFKPLTYKNTISTKNGGIFILGSNDRPGLVNSLSITGGVFIDEFRFINIERMQQDLNAAIRGNTQYWSDNAHLFSLTITTDQPFPDEEAFTYLNDFKKKMNKYQIHLIAIAARKADKINRTILYYKDLRNKSAGFDAKAKITSKITELEIELKQMQKYLNLIRKDSVYFDEASALSNIHVLGKNYLTRNSDSRFTSKLIFKTSFLNIEPNEVENKFYSNLSSKHFIHGTFDKAYDHFDDVGIDVNFELNSSHIIDCKPQFELDVEFDYGDMCTATVSQKVGRTELYIATFEVILPDSIDELVTKICHFFRFHKNKKINIYKDPAGNYQRNRREQTYGYETMLKFRDLGWQATDKVPTGSINPTHDAKHQLISAILKENRSDLPIVRIIYETNRNLELSLKRAPLKLTVRKDGTKEITKDKSSEKVIKLEDKPSLTTDHSDHFDIKLWHKYKHLLRDKEVFKVFLPLTN